MRIKNSYSLINGKAEELKAGDFTATERENGLINVYPLEKNEFYGFGGAFTDSSAYNYFLMTKEEKQKTLEYLFGKSGLKYKICRLCIGSSDFATEEYCYVKDSDEKLSTFDIGRDKKYVIPFIKDVIDFTGGNMYFFASPWSPPAFMKENGTRFKGGKLKKEYYPLYAEYISGFVEAYAAEGIKISAVTLQNEPKAVQTWESCFYTAEDEAEYAVILKKEFKKRGLDVEIWCWDHNKERLFERADAVFSKCGKDVDGAGFHWYSGEHYGAVAALRAKYPDKKLLATEFCISKGIDEVSSLYAEEILGDIDCGANAVVEWNLILDENGGPYHNRQDGCKAPVIYDNATKTAERSEIYFETYAFAHYIENGAKILYVSTFDSSVKACAVKNPNGDIILSVYNSGDRKNAAIYIDGKACSVDLEQKGLYTFVIEN